MLFWLGPIVVFFVVGFLNLSILNRGDWEDSTLYGGLAAFASCLVFMMIIPITAYNSSYDDVRWSDEISGPVKMIQNDDELIFTFTADDKDKVISTVDEDILFLNQDERVFQKTCQTTPAWAAPFNYGTCRYELTVSVN